MTSGSLYDRGLGGSRTWREPAFESFLWRAYCISLQMNVIVTHVSKTREAPQSNGEGGARRAGHRCAQDAGTKSLEFQNWVWEFWATDGLLGRL